MKVLVFDTAEALAQRCADDFSALLRTKTTPVLGLATGASPVPTYKALIERYTAGEISFRNVTTFNLDEYCELPRNDKNSYYTFMHENLFDHVDIKEENVHILNGNAPDFEAEAKSYEADIRAAGGIDLQLLGIGTNGHIGFNEPDVKFTKSTFVVELSQSTVNSNSIYFENSVMPKHAITMGIGSIMAAKKVLLIDTGQKKAEAIRACVRGDITPACPASILQFHPDVTFFLDRDAAKLL